MLSPKVNCLSLFFQNVKKQSRTRLFVKNLIPVNKVRLCRALCGAAPSPPPPAYFGPWAVACCGPLGCALGAGRPAALVRLVVVLRPSSPPSSPPRSSPLSSLSFFSLLQGCWGRSSAPRVRIRPCRSHASESFFSEEVAPSKLVQACGVELMTHRPGTLTR